MPFPNIFSPRPPAPRNGVAVPGDDDDEDLLDPLPKVATEPAAASAFPVATPEPPAPARRPGFSIQRMAAGSPVVAQAFAPEIQAEQRQDAQNEAAATRAQAQADRQAAAEQRQAERDAAAAAKAQQRDRNNAMLAQSRSTGAKTYRDANGNLQPVTDDETGQPAFTPRTGEVQYDPQTGKPFQVNRDRSGNKTTVDPDADAKVGPSDDPADPQLYRQNKLQPWEPIGHVDDLAENAKDPNVKAAAVAYREKRQDDVLKTSVQAAARTAADAQAAHLGAQTQVQTLQASLQSQQAEIDALAQDPAASQTQGGFLGIGAKPTEQAAAIAARRAQKEKELADTQTRLQAAQQALPALDHAAKAAQADHSVWQHSADARAYETLEQQRRAVLAREGKTEDGDPVLAAIAKRRGEIGAKLSTAQQTRAALAPPADENSAPGTALPADATPGQSLLVEGSPANGVPGDGNVSLDAVRNTSGVPALTLASGTPDPEADPSRFDLTGTAGAVARTRAAGVNPAAGVVPAPASARGTANNSALAVANRLNAAEAQGRRTAEQADRIFAPSEPGGGFLAARERSAAREQTARESRQMREDTLRAAGIEPGSPAAAAAEEDRRKVNWIKNEADYEKLSDGTLQINPRLEKKPEAFEAAIVRAQDQGDLTPTQAKAARDTYAATTLERDTAMAERVKDFVPYRSFVAARPDLAGKPPAEVYRAFLQTDPGILDHAGDKMQRAVKGFIANDANLAMGVGILLQGTTGKGQALTRAGERVGQWLDEGPRVSDPRLDDSIGSGAADTVGQAGSQIVNSIAMKAAASVLVASGAAGDAPGAAAGVGLFAVEAAMTGLAQGAGNYQDVLRAMEASNRAGTTAYTPEQMQERAFGAFKEGALANGVLEQGGLELFFRGMPKTRVGRFMAVAAEGAGEAAQEAVSTRVNNAINQGALDTYRAPDELSGNQALGILLGAAGLGAGKQRFEVAQFNREGRSVNALLAAAQAELGPVTADSAAEHLAIPDRRTTGAPPAEADATLAQGFARRNPEAPALAPEVVAVARDLAPFGEETALPVLLQGLDSQIATLEQRAAGVAAGGGPLVGVDYEGRAAAQQELADAYAQKAAVVARSDARLATTQQILALPDWQPPVDPATGQPTEAPDPARTRETATALLKLTQGFPTDELTTAEQARIADQKGVPPLVREAGGQTILTDAGRDALRQAAPAAERFVATSEAEDLRQLSTQAQNTDADAKRTPGDPAQGSRRTSANDETAGTPEAPERRDQGARDPVPTVSAGPESDSRLPADTRRDAGTAQGADPLAERLMSRIREKAAARNVTITPEVEAQTREQVVTASRNVRTALDRYANAFRSTGIDIAVDRSHNSGGFLAPRAGEIALSVDDLLHPDNLRALQDPARAERSVQEEAIHSVALHLEDRGEIDPTAIWTSLPGPVQDRVRALREDRAGRNLGHEFLRMLVQGRVNATERGWTVDNNLITEQQVDPGSRTKLRQAFYKMFRFFRDLQGSLARAKAAPETIAAIQGAADRLETRFREVVEGSRVLPETQGRGTPERPRSTPAERPERAAGPGERPAPPTDRPRAAPPAGEPDLARPDAGEAGRGLPEGELIPAAGRLGVKPEQIGHVAEVEGNSGQRVRTAYVVREAAESRASHRPDGSPTPGYDQSLQPRDRTAPAYRAQQQRIASDLDLSKVAESRRPDEGAPIVTRAGDTLTGNGRDIAIGSAYAQGAPSAGRYRAELVRRAGDFGLDRAVVARMKAPVLKRVILDDLAPEDLRRFSQESNESPAMASNALEVAGQDASRIDAPLLSLYDPNYSLESPKNADFLRSYGQQVVLGRTSAREGASGANQLNLTPADLARRVRAGLFAHAYGMDNAGRAALERMAGDTPDRGRNVSEGLLTLAPVMARMRADLGTGDLHPGYDLAPALGKAAQELSEAIANRPAKQPVTAAVDDLLSQGELLAGDPLERAALEFLARHRTNRGAIEETLSDYAESVYALGNPKDGDLFGERTLPSALDLLQNSARGVDSGALKSQRAALRSESAATLREKTEDKLDPRLEKAFGPDWHAGFDGLALPRFPVTLEDRGRGDLARPTMEADRPETLKATATVTAESPLGRLYPALAGKTVSRQTLHGVILNHFLREGRARPAGEPKVAWLSGGGGGAGKSTILNLLAERGKYSREGLVSINADDIKELIPEYHDIADLGDSRAAAVVHEESSMLAKQLQARALGMNSDILFDGTLANQGKSLKLINTLKDAGYTVKLVAVTIDPYEALVRAMTRARRSGRYVPIPALLEAHRHFNANVPELIRAADEANVFDNSGRDAVEVPVADALNGRYAPVGERSRLDPHATRRADLLDSYAPEAGRDARRADPTGRDAGRDGADAATGDRRPAGRPEGAPEGADRVPGVTAEPLRSRRAPGEGQGDFFSSLEAADEARDYARSLPAAAKASRPAFKTEVAKDLPHVASNDAALGELFALAQPGGVGPERTATAPAGDGLRGPGPGAAPDRQDAPVRPGGGRPVRPARAGEVREPDLFGGSGDRAGAGQPGGERGGRDGRAADADGRVRVEPTGPDAAQQPGGRGNAAVRDGSGTGDAGDAGKPPVIRPRRELRPEDQNHRIAPGEDLAPRGNPSKFRANLDAIGLLKRLQSENRQATPAEKQVLARYTGWGWAGEYFNRDNARYATEHAEIRQNLTDAEFRAAAASTVNAHYTAPKVISAMWRMAERLGFKGGNVLEPAGGVGHFFGLMPENLASRSRLEGVELDRLSAGIMEKLYPQAKVFQGGFQEARIPNNSLDLAISNVPFGNFKVPGGKDYPNLLIHDYFFARSLDKVKPGGLVLFITSDGTLDKGDPRVRKLLAEKADLVGAVRLPNTAFAENAGTQVTTDIIALRKKDGTPFRGEPFGSLATVGEGTFKGTTKPLRVNEYYAAHPENALGEHSLAGTMYAGGDYALTERRGQDTGALLDQAADRLPESVFGADRGTPRGEEDAKQAEVGQREGSTQRTDTGDFTQVRDGQQIEPEWLTRRNFGDSYEAAITPSQAEERKQVAGAWLGVRDAARTLLDAENDPGQTAGTLTPLRQELNRAYDAFTRRFGSLNRRPGQQHLEKARFLEDDPDYSLVQALEDEKRLSTGQRPVDPATGRERYEFTKGKIFRERIRSPKAAPERADNVADAVAIALGHRGAIDPAHVGKLLGVSPEEARARIVESGRAYENPATGLFETRERYLSGNVRQKLAAAERAAEANPVLRPNVDALRAVQPADVPMHEIFAALGSRWVPTEVLQAFVKDTLKADTDVRYSPELNGYTTRVRRGGGSPEILTTYGTSDLSGLDLLTHALNGTEPTVTRSEKQPDGSSRTYTDQAATAAAREKLGRLKQEFQSWARTTAGTVRVDGEDRPIQAHMERTYNEVNNAMVAPSYDGSYLALPGVTDTVRRLPHRMSVVARVLQEGSAMMAHGVGSGKTFSQIVGAMEMKRTGQSKKPMVVVQKATIGQFAASFRQAYPDAKLLVASAKDFAEKNRARFMAKIATGDYDAVIVTQPQFDRLPSKPETIRRYYEEQLDALESAIRANTEQSGKDDPTTKELEKAKMRLEAKMQNRVGALQRRQDNALHFEELGVDSLWMDEAHAYKKIPIITRKQNVRGIPNDDSQRAIGLEMKVRHVQDNNQGRNVILATGTPITNSIAEAYVMLKLATPHVLENYGIRTFDDFANTFGETQTKLEYTWAGTWKNATRFNRFTNGPELITMIRSGFDVKMGNKELGLKVPEMKGGGPQTKVVAQTPAMQEVSRFLDDVATAYEASTDKREISYVPIVTMQAGMAGALDPRLINPGAADDAGSKVNTALREVLRIHRETAGERKTQMVFADRFKPMDVSKLRALVGGRAEKITVQEGESAPAGEVVENTDGTVSDVEEVARAKQEADAYRSGGFNLYRDMKAKLIAAGVPEREVAIIHDYNTDQQREKLFDDVNAGNVRILIGSTEKMGVGVNAQKKLYAIHHLDPPRMMTPAMMEQRDGRIIRQGNDNPEIENFRYGTERSMDTAIYQMLENKARFISQALSGRTDLRTFDDAADEASLSMSQMKALTSGDPRVIRKAELEAQLGEMENSRTGFERERGNAARRLADSRSTAAAIERKHLPAARDFGERLAAAVPKDPEARKALAARLDEGFSRLDKQVLEGGREDASTRTDVNGVHVQLWSSPSNIERTETTHALRVFGAEGDREAIRESRVADGAGVLQSLAGVARGWPERVATLERDRDFHQGQIPELEKAASRPWEKETEMRRMQDELGKINQDLAGGKGDAGQGDLLHPAPLEKVPAIAQLTGEPINSRRTAFAPDSGTLNIPRFNMPQIAAEHRGALANFLKSRGIEWQNEEVLPGSLKPTQGDFNPGKVEKARAYAGDTERRILVSADGHVVDGHHQWMAHLADHPDEPMGVVRLNAPVRDILGQIHEFPSAGMEKAPDIATEPAGAQSLSQIIRDRVLASDSVRNAVANSDSQNALTEIEAEIRRTLGTLPGEGAINARTREDYDAFASKLGSRMNLARMIYERARTLRSGPASLKDFAPRPDEDPVSHLLRILNAPETERLTTKAEGEKPGERTVGRPDLAFGASDPRVMGVDAAMQADHSPQTHEAWTAEANERLARDYDGEKRNLATKALRGDQLDSVETKVAQQIVARELSAPDSPAQRRNVQALIMGYRMTGREQARAFTARRDPFQTPADRHKEFLGRMIFTPPREVQAKLDGAKTPAERQAILDADQARVSRIEGELKKMGVSFDDIFRGEVELKLRGAKIIANTAGELFDGGRQRALKLLQSGTMSFADAAKATGLSSVEVEKAYGQMREALKAKLRDKVRRGAGVDNLAAEQGALLSEPAGKSEPTLRSDAETEAELERVLAAMGYGNPATVGKMKARAPRKEKKPIFRPPVVPGVRPATMDDPTGPLTPAERAARDLGQSGLRLDQEHAGGTGERAVPRFTNARGQEQGRIDLGERPPPSGPNGERAGGRFTNSAGTEQGKIDLGDTDAHPTVVSRVDLSDPGTVHRLARAIQSADSNRFDMAYEYWINNILSGPQTQVANVAGNSLNAGWQMTVQRGMEAMLNTAYRDKDSAQFGEFRHLARGLLPGLAKGWKFGLEAFDAERDIFEQRALDGQMAFADIENLGGIRAAIPGRTGRVIRIPGRLLTFADSFFKHTIGQMEVGAHAYRLAKGEGLTGDAMERRIADLVDTPGSEAWQRAVETTRETVFQSDVKTREEGGSLADDTVAHFTRAARGNLLLSTLFPFIRTPYNIFKTGLAMTPVGSVAVAARFARGLYRMKDGRPMIESYGKAQQVQDLARQLIAWTTMALLSQAVEGDGDDDDKKLILLTGSRPFTMDKSGQRDLAERTVGGQNNLRLGGPGGVNINYGRYEPFATVLGTMADMIRTQKARRHGATLGDQADKLYGYFLSQASDKTFLQGLSDLTKSVANGGRLADKAQRAVLTALVPNLVRQPLRNLDDFQRDGKSGGAAYALLPVAANAPKAVDAFGEPNEKGGNPVSRLVFPASVKPDAPTKLADRLLLNWNRDNPGRQWAPNPPARKYHDAKTNKEKEMTPAEYVAYGTRAGERFKQKLATVVNSANAARPKEADIHAMRKALQDAHREVHEEMFGSKRQPFAVRPVPKTAAAKAPAVDLASVFGWK